MEGNLEQAVDMAVQDAMSQQLFIQGGITTVVVFVAIFAARYFLTHFVKGKAEILDKAQRRWLNHINNGTGFVLVLALILIWAPQIHTFALSLTAFAVAVVLSTKELIMCVTGGLLRASTQAFAIGDWITVDGKTGEVMRITTLCTTMEEISPAEKGHHYTGRTIQIPHSRFLTSNIENENFIRSHIYHEIVITLKENDQDPAKLMAHLEKLANEQFEPYREEAVKFNKKVERKAAVDFDDPDPKFSLKTADKGEVVFSVRMFVPTRKTDEIETAITMDFLSYVVKNKKAKAA